MPYSMLFLLVLLARPVQLVQLFRLVQLAQLVWLGGQQLPAATDSEASGDGCCGGEPGALGGWPKSRVEQLSANHCRVVGNGDDIAGEAAVAVDDASEVSRLRTGVGAADDHDRLAGEGGRCRVTPFESFKEEGSCFGVVVAGGGSDHDLGGVVDHALPDRIRLVVAGVDEDQPVVLGCDGMKSIDIVGGEALRGSELEGL